MSKWNKLIARLYSLDTDLRYADLSKILKSYGYIPQETNGGSSHITYRKKGRTPITIPRHGKIKKAYIELVRSAVEKEESNG